MNLRVRSQLNLVNWNAPFFGLALVFIYAYAFQATKPSPFSYISIDEHVLVVAQLLGVAAILAMVYAACGWVVHKLLKQCAGTVIRVISVFLLSIFLMIVIDNFMYTLFGIGVKSTDSLLLRILVAYAAIRVAMDLQQLPQKWSIILRTKRWMVPLAASVSLAFITWGFSGTVNVKLIKPLVGLPNILILSSDGIDSSHMGVYGYERETTPFMTSKMEEFAIFENAYSNNSKTTGSVTSFLLGTSPGVNGVIFPPDILRQEHSIQGFPQMLGGFGYYRSNWGVEYYASARSQNMIGAFELDSGSRVFPVLSQWLPQSYELSRWLIIDGISQVLFIAKSMLLNTPLNNPVDIVTGQQSHAQDLANIEHVMQEFSRSEPVFINTHFMMTHGAFFTITSPYFSRGKVQTDPWQRDFYDDSIREFDATVQRVYKFLKNVGYLDKTIIIITSDHGSRWSNLNRVPLMIRFPKKYLAGSYGGMSQRLDVAPTLLQYIGQPIPQWMSGRSLMSTHSCSRAIYSYGVISRSELQVNNRDAEVFNEKTISILKNGYAVTIKKDKFKSLESSFSFSEILSSINVRALEGTCLTENSISNSELLLMLKDFMEINLTMSVVGDYPD